MQEEFGLQGGSVATRGPEESEEEGVLEHGSEGQSVKTEQESSADEGRSQHSSRSSSHDTSISRDAEFDLAVDRMTEQVRAAIPAVVENAFRTFPPPACVVARRRP